MTECGSGLELLHEESTALLTCIPHDPDTLPQNQRDSDPDGMSPHGGQR